MSKASSSESVKVRALSFRVARLPLSRPLLQSFLHGACELMRRSPVTAARCRWWCDAGR